MKDKTKKIFGVVVFVLILILAVYSFMTFLDDRDDGEYDYCVEWIGFGGGTLNRDSLIYTCYNLATSTFYCDYEIMRDNTLVIKPITNITKNDEGFITEIIYDKPNSFNCTRWLKSERVKW